MSYGCVEVVDMLPLFLLSIEGSPRIHMCRNLKRMFFHSSFVRSASSKAGCSRFNDILLSLIIVKRKDYYETQGLNQLTDAVFHLILCEEAQ